MLTQKNKDKGSKDLISFNNDFLSTNIKRTDAAIINLKKIKIKGGRLARPIFVTVEFAPLKTESTIIAMRALVLSSTIYIKDI